MNPNRNGKLHLSVPTAAGFMFAQYRSRTFSVPTYVILACLTTLLLITALHVTYAVYSIRLLQQMLPVQKEYTYLNGDFPAQLPLAVPSVGLVLEGNNGRYRLQDDDDWATVFPSNGFTDLGPNNKTFLVSMIHQLHCLDNIRVGYVVNGPNTAEHIEHCLTYLRQFVLCQADTTLEEDHPQWVDDADGNHLYADHSANGVGAVHRCKDWTAVRSYLKEHPASDAIPQLRS